MNNEVLTFDRLPIAVNQLIDAVNRIEKMLTRPTEPPNPLRFGFIGAVDYLNGLGFSISKSKLSKLTAEGKLPCYKFNGRIVFEKEKLDEWVASQMVTVGDTSEVALTLAKSANRKRRHKS